MNFALDFQEFMSNQQCIVWQEKKLPFRSSHIYIILHYITLYTLYTIYITHIHIFCHASNLY